MITTVIHKVAGIHPVEMTLSNYNKYMLNIHMATCPKDYAPPHCTYNKFINMYQRAKQIIP